MRVVNDKIIYDKVCSNCGITFESNYPATKYCNKCKEIPKKKVPIRTTNRGLRIYQGKADANSSSLRYLRGEKEISLVRDKRGRSFNIVRKTYREQVREELTIVENYDLKLNRKRVCDKLGIGLKTLNTHLYKLREEYKNEKM